MKQLNMPNDVRMFPIYNAFTKWLIQTGNKDLLISYSQFETELMEIIMKDDVVEAKK